MTEIWRSFISGCLLATLLSACATPPSDENSTETAPSNSAATDSAPRLMARPLSQARTSTESALEDMPPKPPQIFQGTGNFINPTAATAQPVKTVTQTAQGEVTLNFDGADIRDVVKVIFETLKENYTVDPQVQGEVTVQTTRPLTREQLLPTLETILRMSNAILVRERGMNRIVPAAGAVQKGGFTPRLGGGGVGYGVRIVPLRYVSAIEMQTIIAPFLPEGGILHADPIRNLLIVSGTPQELANVQGTIDTFDVNWLKGMSIGMFRLRNVDSQGMATNLNQLFGEESKTPIAGLLRFVPLSKLNAVLVVTPQAEYLKEIAVWIERLDGVGGERLYVYQVQNSRADYVAELLNGLFNLGSSGTGNRGGELAPGLRPAQLSGGAGGTVGSSGTTGLSSGSGLGSRMRASSLPGSTTTGSGTSSLGTGSTGLGGSSGSLGTLGGGRPSTGTAGGTGGVSGLGSGGPSAGMEEVRIVADVENNALLIWATNQNYERIISTLQKMDVAPRQVLIEATIAEVKLTGHLQYGLQWFFNNEVGSNNGSNYTGSGALGLTSSGLTLNNVLNGQAANSFTYAITNQSGNVRALLKALASDSKVKILSSPQLMVLDNQQALIRVGDQQPISSGTVTTSGGVTTTGGVEYKNTGVLLEVLPRVNSGGLVNMEIKQEVVDVGEIDQATRQRSFLERSITSKVVVQSGQTLVLGGLIRDTRTDTQGGLPILYKIPVVGSLFGNTTQSLNRTELIVLITPRVVRNPEEADQVTDEIKRKMQEIAPLVPMS